MTQQTREAQCQALFPGAPAYRLRQITEALFDSSIHGYDSITALPKTMREMLHAGVPWLAIAEVAVYESKNHDTFKAILQGMDGKQFESVLMANKRGQWTICVSSQIGCAMRCTFCATGTMGLSRSLLADEIVDQYRYWQQFLSAHPQLPARISNVVFMGMGEPMANYENVKRAIHTWLEYTDIGSTHITVSSVGILSQLEKVLTDPDWPPVRIAISLHSANQARREQIVPTTIPDFLQKLEDWARRYQTILGNRRHHITYEYTLLHGVNDTPQLAEELAKYIRTTGVSKINVIPYNPVVGKTFARSQRENVDLFKAVLRAHDIDVTERRTMGDDIAAACGQLVVNNK